MKNFLFLLTISFIATSVFAQSPKFNDAMAKTIAEMDTLNTGDQMMAVANKFERIAMAEKNQWLPYYYSALSRCSAVFVYNDVTKNDNILDVAEKHAKTADSLQPKNSEILVLRSMIMGGRIMVDPMTRGQQLGMQSMMLINEAMQIDPTNPRAYYIMGQSLFYTPPQFGGGKEAGCSMFTKSKQNFALFTPASAIHPNWGEVQVDMMLKLCTSGTPPVDPVSGGDKE